MYALELKTGNDKVLNDYLEYVEKQNEILPGALNIIESANVNNFCVDEAMEKLVPQIPPINSDVTYLDGTQLFHFWYEKAVYSFKKNRLILGIDELLYALYLAHKMRYYSGFEKSVSLYREHGDYATEQQKWNYKHIVEGVFDS
ncbi:hypothetical protein ACFCP7_12685 [Paenibacillus elgii]